MNLSEVVGNRIRQIRKSKGWTQEHLAEVAGLHYSYIGGVERGDRNISMETLEKIIKAFQVPAVEIFKFEQDNEYLRALDEHMTVISSLNTAEIRSITQINKEVINTIRSIKN